MSQSEKGTVKRTRKLAKNGVRQIIKSGWTQIEFEAWLASLETKNTPTNSSADIYELIQTGNKNFLVTGGKFDFWADGIEDQTILEAKFVGKPERSPYIENSDCPDFIRLKSKNDLDDEFSRIIAILLSADNPLTLLRIITNSNEALPYFEKLTREHRIPCEIVIKTESDILPNIEPES